MKKYIVLITTLILTISTFFLMPGVKANTGSNINISNLNELPEVTGRFEDGANRTKTGKVEFKKNGSLYEIKVKHPDGNTYTLTTLDENRPLPIELPYSIESKGDLILESGIYFRNESGDKIIYYEFQNPSSSNKANTSILEDKDVSLNGARPHVMWNITQGIFDVNDKLTMIGVHYAGTDRRAYVDMYSNIDIDDILMIEFKWEYRYKKLFGGHTPWAVDNVTRYKDETVNATSLWHEYKRIFKFLYGGGFATMEWFKLAERMNQETIQKLNYQTEEYKNNYVEKLNNRLSKDKLPPMNYGDLFDREYSIYRIYLDTYSKGLHTDYEINDNIVLVDIMYEYQGEYFHPIIEDIDWTGVGGKGSEAIDHEPPFIKAAKGFLNWLKDTFGKFYTVAIIVIIIILIVLVLEILRFIRGLFGRY